MPLRNNFFSNIIIYTFFILLWQLQFSRGCFNFTFVYDCVKFVWKSIINQSLINFNFTKLHILCKICNLLLSRRGGGSSAWWPLTPGGRLFALLAPDYSCGPWLLWWPLITLMAPDYSGGPWLLAEDYFLSKLADSAEFLHFFSPLFIEQTFMLLTCHFI